MKQFHHKPKKGTKQAYILKGRSLIWRRLWGDEAVCLTDEEARWVTSFWKAKQIFSWHRNFGKARGEPHPMKP